MSIITLTTDYGHKDHFVGATKGKILSEYKEATIIDISHEIDKFNVSNAGYCVSACYHNFPKGTIHIIDVDSELTQDAQHIAVEWNDHFFICADNGILTSLIQKKNPQKIVAINIHERLNKKATNMDVFVAVACHIARGGLLNVIGKEIDTVYTNNELAPQISNDKNSIRGNIIYIDDFGNCVTNLSNKLITEIGQGRKFSVQFLNKKIDRIHRFYGDFKSNDKNSLKNLEGTALALFNENDFLELAIYKGTKSIGSANSLLGLDYRDVVTINFE